MVGREDRGVEQRFKFGASDRTIGEALDRAALTEKVDEGHAER